MKARLITKQTPMGQRARLGTELPLAAPYLFQVFPVYACNFKCNYCVFSVPKAERGYISSQKTLDTGVYRKCIDSIGEFSTKLRMLRFAGTGEPLLHPDMAGMIEYAAKAQVAETIDVVTNGALLSREVAQGLVNAGVNRVRISIQGVSANKYREITQTFGDVEQIIDNIAYLHSIKGETEVYVKIIDSALTSFEEERKFFRIFGDIADVISVEHLLPATPLIDYAKVAGNAAMDKTQNGARIADTEICPQPFYMLQLNPDGMVVPCCGMESPMVIADAKDVSIVEMWNGEILNKFRRLHLAGARSSHRVCGVCQQYRYAMFEEDVLDDDAPRLLAAYD